MLDLSNNTICFDDSALNEELFFTELGLAAQTNTHCHLPSTDFPSSIVIDEAKTMDKNHPKS